MSLSSDLALLISLLLSRCYLLLFTSIHPAPALCLSLLYRFAIFRTHKLCPLPSYIHSLRLVRSSQAVSGILRHFIQMYASSQPWPTYLDPPPCANCGWASPRPSGVPHALAYPFPTASSSEMPDFPIEGNSPGGFSLLSVFPLDLCNLSPIRAGMFRLFH